MKESDENESLPSHHHENPLVSLRKYFLVIVLFIIGGLITLAGFGLLTISPQLLVYSGLALLVMSVVYYFLY